MNRKRACPQEPQMNSEGTAVLSASAAAESTSQENRKDHNEGSGGVGRNLLLIIFILSCVGFTELLAFLCVNSDEFSLYILAAVAIGIQWVVYIHAAGLLGNTPTEKYYDITGTFTFLTVLGLSVWPLAWNINIRQIILLSCASMWTIRLGLFLFIRIHRAGSDSRFQEMKKSPLVFLVTWTVQGVWVFVTALPILSMNQITDAKALGVMDFIGISLWVFGFIFEFVADLQKLQFKNNARNQFKWISTGLWSVSRHPNYFGEIILWIGIAVSAFNGMSTLRQKITMWVSPLFVALLLIFVSGIPLLEKKANEKYGEDDEYVRYKRRTPVLIPLVGCRGDARF